MLTLPMPTLAHRIGDRLGVCLGGRSALGGRDGGRLGTGRKPPTGLASGAFVAGFGKTAKAANVLWLLAFGGVWGGLFSLRPTVVKEYASGDGGLIGGDGEGFPNVLHNPVFSGISPFTGFVDFKFFVAGIE